MQVSPYRRAWWTVARSLFALLRASMEEIALVQNKEASALADRVLPRHIVEQCLSTISYGRCRSAGESTGGLAEVASPVRCPRPVRQQHRGPADSEHRPA